MTGTYRREVCEHCNFTAWLTGLPPWLQPAAALGVARLALPAWCRSNCAWADGVALHDFACGKVHAALDALANYLRRPTAERRSLWARACNLGVDGDRIHGVIGTPEWVPDPIQNPAETVAACADLHGAVHAAAREACVGLLLHGEGWV